MVKNNRWIRIVSICILLLILASATSCYLGPLHDGHRGGEGRDGGRHGGDEGRGDGRHGGDEGGH